MARSMNARYVSGMLSGIALAVPLCVAVSWFSADVASRAAAADYAQVSSNIQQAPVDVNRAAKSARLPLVRPRLDAQPSSVTTLSDAATSIVTKSMPAGKHGSGRVGTPPKGCLSAVGGLNANIATEETTVCVADISMIRDEL